MRLHWCASKGGQAGLQVTRTLRLRKASAQGATDILCMHTSIASRGYKRPEGSRPALMSVVCAGVKGADSRDAVSW